MPYQWSPAPDTRLHLWPHRSLPKRGFVWFIGITAALIAAPLVSLVGNPALWVLLPFLLAAIAAIWWALQRSYRDGEIVEDLTFTPDLITLTRHGPGGAFAAWEGNPYWLRVTLHPTGGPVPDYLTLSAGAREVELGVFLTQEERIALRDDVQLRLADLRASAL